MPADEYPRVCIVAANPLCSTTTNGILISSLFAGWPKNRLTQIYFPVLVPYQPEFDVCTDFRMVRTSGRVISLGPDDPEPGAAPTSAEPETTARRRLLQYLRKHPLLHQPLKVWQEVWYAHSWLGAVVRRQLRQIQPDLVYACLGNYCLTRITCQACEELGLPLFIRVADDFVTSLYSHGPARVLRDASERWFERTVRLAGGRAGNSPIMAEEYGARYGGHWLWFATLVDPEDYDPSPHEVEGPLRLVFTGNLGIGRWRPLRQLGLALRILRERDGLEARLVVHSFPEQLEAFRKELEIPSVVELAGWAPYGELPEIYHRADLLVHGESFDEAMTEYTALSFSGKLSQYMMAGRCILALAPRRLASARVVEASGGGVCVDETEPEALATALRGLLRDRERIAEHGRQGRLWALEHVARAPSQARFRTGLLEAISHHRRQSVTGAVESR